jgi:sugar phosphate isomerase/epimerase
MTKRKLGFMPSGNYTEKSVDEVCESLKKIGYEAVEWLPHFASPRTHSEKELSALVKTSQKYGLEISEIIVQQDLIVLDESIRKDNINYIKECINSYSDIGVNTINLFTGPVPWKNNPLIIGKDISEGDAWNMLYKAVDEILPLAERKQIHLAFENVWGMLCHDIYTMKHLINNYKSNYLGVNYDPSHDIIAGHSDIGWIIKNWKGYIKHVHLKDAVGCSENGKFIFPLPGEGNVDWKAFSAALDWAGYFGPMSVEFESFNYVSKIWKSDFEKAAITAFENFKTLL